MKDLLLIAMALVTLFAILSWASAPAATMTEHTARLDAEAKVALLSTRVAELVPTVIVRCPAYPRC